MRIYRPIAVLLLVAQTGCYRTRTLQSPSELAGTRTGRLWVTTNGGTVISMAAVRVIDDTIFGFDDAGKQTALAFSEAKTVRVREVATGKTVALMAAGIGVAVALAVVLKGGGATVLPLIDCDKHPDANECMPK